MGTLACGLRSGLWPVVYSSCTNNGLSVFKRLFKKEAGSRDPMWSQNLKYLLNITKIFTGPLKESLPTLYYNRDPRFSNYFSALLASYETIWHG